MVMVLILSLPLCVCVCLFLFEVRDHGNNFLFLFYCLKTYKQVIALENFNFIISTMNLNECIRNAFTVLTRQIQQIGTAVYGYDCSIVCAHAYIYAYHRRRLAQFGTFDAIEISNE